MDSLRSGSRDERVVVALGLVGGGESETSDGLVHLVALAEITRDGGRVAGLGVCERESPPAELAVFGELVHALWVELHAALHVPELPHIEMHSVRMDTPSQEDVRS